jgi:hypothetical protein
VQLRLEHAPTGIQHGFRHLRLRQFQTAHIADFDDLIVVYDLPGKLVQGVLSPPRGRPVQALGLAFVSAALRHGDFPLDASIEMTRMKLISITRCRDVL